MGADRNLFSDFTQTDNSECSFVNIFRIYALFGLLFIVALVILVVLLMRMKIFQAIKMGETV